MKIHFSTRQLAREFAAKTGRKAPAYKEAGKWSVVINKKVN